jgi:hypothetical protein
MNLGSAFLAKIQSHFLVSALSLPAELFVGLKKGFQISDPLIIAKPNPLNQNTYELYTRAGTSLF